MASGAEARAPTRNSDEEDRRVCSTANGCRVQTLSQPFFERSDPDLNRLIDSKLAALSDALHQGVDQTAQGSVMLRLSQINVAHRPFKPTTATLAG